MTVKKEENIENVDHKDREHYEIGGSNFDMRVNCIGSLFLEKDLSSIDTDASKEGTRFHELLDITGIVLAETYNKTGTLVPIDDLMNFATVDNWSREMQKNAREWYSEETGLYYFINKYKPKKIFPEKKFKFKGVNPPMGGTADFFFAFLGEDNKPRIFLRDQKYGEGKLVEANTLQLAFYMAAIASQLSGRYEFHGGFGSIHQPRLEDEDGEVERIIEYNKEELDGFIQLALDTHKKCYAVKTREEAEKLTKPGKWCFFCKAATTCRAFMSQNKELSVISFNDAENALEENEDIEELAAEALVDLLDTPEKLAKFLRYSDFLKEVMSKAKARAMAMILNEDKEVPGFKIVEKKRNRSFDDAKKIETAKHLQSYGVENPFETSLIKVTTAEALIAEKIYKEIKESGKKATKKASTQAAKAILEEVVTRKEPGYNLVQDDPEHLSSPRITKSTLADREFEGVDISEFDFKELDEDFDL